ncbi:hypothetical protein ACFSM5_16720 [Lacibacterium aquatile]|uniref:PAS domain-containing protein n=1 Tax=Lacibacterium aquatile TaxID=1168082 RepID=A0ABW5DVR1_9PROT
MSSFDDRSAPPKALRQILLPREGGVAGSPVLKLSPPLERLLLFWQELAQKGPPRRKDLKPELLADILPNILLVDALPDLGFRSGFRFRYRLVGTAHREHNSFDLTGKYVDEIQPGDRFVLAEDAWSEIFEVGAPGYWRQYHLTGLLTRTPYHFYERIFAPFYGDDGQPQMLAGVWHWVYRSDTGAISQASELVPGAEKRFQMPK